MHCCYKPLIMFYASWSVVFSCNHQPCQTPAFCSVSVVCCLENEKSILSSTFLRCSVTDVLVLKDLIQDASGRKSEFQSLDVYFQLHHNSLLVYKATVISCFQSLRRIRLFSKTRSERSQCVAALFSVHYSAELQLVMDG